MKPTNYIIGLLLTVLICSGLCLASAQNNRKCESMLVKQEKAILKLTEHIDIISKQNNAGKIDKIEKLAKENLLLRQENADLKAQIETFGWWK